MHAISTLSLFNTLHVLSLSHKLLFVGLDGTKLNRVVLIYPYFFLFQDILTKEIIGCGIKRRRLHYVDDFNIGQSHLVHHPNGNKKCEIWLWHRRLGHPSFGYMKHLFPELLLNVSDFSLRCNTRIFG